MRGPPPEEEGAAKKLVMNRPQPHFLFSRATGVEEVENTGSEIEPVRKEEVRKVVF